MTMTMMTNLKNWLAAAWATVRARGQTATQQQLETILYQSKLVEALHHALVKSRDEVEQARTDNHNNVLILVTAAGGKVTLSRDLIDSVVNHGTALAVDVSRAEDGSLTLTVVDDNGGDDEVE